MFKLLTNQQIIFTVIDILLVILILNRLFKLMRGTKGILFINSIIILYLAAAAAVSLNFKYLPLLLNWIVIMLIVAIPILFQNELKQAMETLGRRTPFIKWLVKPPVIAIESIDIITDAVDSLARQKIGALIIFEREDLLQFVQDSGSYIDSIISKILVKQIFYPNSPLHDGAILIKGNRILAAGCFLPLDIQLPLPQELGSRHRAGLTLATQSDALVIVVSEETGGISLAYNGVLETGYNSERLKATLKELIRTAPGKPTASGPVETNKEVH